MNNIIEISSMVLGLTAIAGNVGLSSRYKPLFALIVGIGASYLYAPLSKEMVILGIISSLTAMGLWSGAKNSTDKIQ